MIVQCQSALSLTPDHYECDQCHTFVGGLFEPACTCGPAASKLVWKFCPFCGAPLHVTDETYGQIRAEQERDHWRESYLVIARKLEVLDTHHQELHTLLNDSNSKLVQIQLVIKTYTDQHLSDVKNRETRC